MDAIELVDLTKIFPGKKGARVKALDHLDLRVPQGEVFGFLGPNGAGKSTTIKILIGLIRPTQGQALLMGTPSTLSQARLTTGYLPENPAFYDYLNAVEYLAFIGQSFKLDTPTIAARSETILQRLSLWEARKRPIRSYSKGMVQRLGIAQVLIHQPEIYILDEPMSGLDPIGRALVKEIILELKAAGKCVFFSTHITSDVEAVCDRVGVILMGKLQTVQEVGTLMEKGITGYHIRHRMPGQEIFKESTIRPEELQVFMTNIFQSGEEVIFLEPLRKNLEAFFLSIVSQGSSNDQ
jgi:ABC-2 type transport system ATP-binding protein